MNKFYEVLEKREGYNYLRLTMFKIEMDYHYDSPVYKNEFKTSYGTFIREGSGFKYRRD
jgi:hypothetical protein